MNRPVIVAIASILTVRSSAACAQTPSPAAGEARPTSDAMLSFKIESAILGESRRIFVSLPLSFEKSAPDRRYPVTVVVDGEELTRPVRAVSEHLSNAGQIPEAIIVGIENTNRLRDLTPPGLSVSGSSTREGGDRFIDFIEKELLPEIDRRYRGSAPRTFVGHSSGGILATWIAATRTSFREVVAIDTPMHLQNNWLVERLMERASNKSTPPLRYASLETRFGWTEPRWKALVAAAPSSWKLTRQKLEHESHESMAMLASYIGLREVFNDYSSLAAPISPTTSTLPYYARLDSAFGAPLIPPRRILNNVTEDLLMEGRGAAARSAFTTLVRGYGAPSNSATTLARIAEVEKQPLPSETVESLLATPFSTPREAEKYIGEWVGDVWMNADEPRDDSELFTIRIVDGRIVGETTHLLPDGEVMKQSWTYFRVTPAGMTFGFMNGMRPRGMLLYEGTLKGDVLSGVMAIRGVNFIHPEGLNAPVVRFQFRRKPAAATK